MRHLVTMSIPVEAGNRAISDGTMGKVIGTFLEQTNPESAVFVTDDHGDRCGYVVMDLPDTTDIPRLFEPIFQQLNARITYRACMNAADLQAGLAKLS